MTITLQLSPDIEARIREAAARQDVESVRRRLTEAVSASVESTVNALIQDPLHGLDKRPGDLTDAEFEAIADELAGLDPSAPPLSDWAMSREGIYADHP